MTDKHVISDSDGSSVTDVKHFQLFLNDSDLHIRTLSEPLQIDVDTLRVSIVNEGYQNFDIPDETLSLVSEKLKIGEAGEYLLAQSPKLAHITFAYKEETREYFARISISDEPQELTIQAIKQRVLESEHSTVELDNAALNKLLVCAQQKKTGEHLIGKKPFFTSLKLIFDETTNIVSAKLYATEENPDISISGINELLKEKHYDDYYIEPNAITKIFQKIQSNEWGEYPLAQRKNASIKIEFDEELMHAYISVWPPFGGRELDLELLQIAIKNAEVDPRSCDKTILKTILQNKTAERVAFATGQEPSDGQDTTFEALVEETIMKKPEQSKSGKIDTREVLDFTIVEPGQKLMLRHPPRDGVNGYNVKGQVIPAVHGEDIPFNTDITGAIVSPENENLLIADGKGHPVILKDGVRVDKTLVVNNVAMATGHVTFDGSLLVRGEVMPGMKINVTGDIVVQGVVSNAILQAKNNITVKCGIIGADPEDKENPDYTCVVKAGGEISAQYINQSKIFANESLHIREYISHSDVDVKNKIFAGQQGGKGRIFGGNYYAQMGVSANSVGVEGGTKTLVSSGPPESQQKQYEKLLKSQVERKEQLDKITEILKKKMALLKENPQDVDSAKKVMAIKDLKTNLQNEIQKLDTVVADIEKLFKHSRYAKIEVRKSTMPNVTFQICGAEFNIRQEGKGGVFEKLGSDIRWNNL